MKNDSNWLIAVLMVAVLFGGSLASCFWPSDTTEEEFSVTGEVIGISSYNQPKLDLKSDVLSEHSIPLGSLFTIQTEDSEFENAVLLNAYLGFFMFDIYVNIESDGYLSIGCVGKLITAEQGSKVTLTYTGTSDRFSKTPKYNSGYTDNRADYASDEEFANFY